MIPAVEFPQAYQFLFEPHRYKVVPHGRGAASSWSFARALLLQGAQRPLRVVCCRETMESIAQSVHEVLERQIPLMRLEDYYPLPVQKSAIQGRNGTEFLFAGLKHNVSNIKSLEGADIVWVEEAESVSKSSWETLIPTVRKENSEIWVSFNPKLYTDDTYKRFVLNPPSTAKVVALTYRDNPFFPEVLRIEMEDLKLRDPAAYRHVWEGEPRSSVEGAIYGSELAQALAENRITSVPYDRTRPVDTFWDIGFYDKTSVWFAQSVQGWYHLIDYLEGQGKAIHDYLILLQQKGYVYGTDWLPHDAVDTIIHQRLAADKSRSIEMLMRNAGRKVRIVPKMLVTSGINAVRTILPLCRFDSEKCADGLQGLRHYQWGPEAANGQERRQPLHDWASHPSDAFRGFAIAAKQPELEHRQAPRVPRPASGPNAWMG